MDKGEVAFAVLQNLLARLAADGVLTTEDVPILLGHLMADAHRTKDSKALTLLEDLEATIVRNARRAEF